MRKPHLFILSGETKDGEYFVCQCYDEHQAHKIFAALLSENAPRLEKAMIQSGLLKDSPFMIFSGFYDQESPNEKLIRLLTMTIFPTFFPKNDFWTLPNNLRLKNKQIETCTFERRKQTPVAQKIFVHYFCFTKRTYGIREKRHERVYYTCYIKSTQRTVGRNCLLDWYRMSGHPEDRFAYILPASAAMLSHYKAMLIPNEHSGDGFHFFSCESPEYHHTAQAYNILRNFKERDLPDFKGVSALKCFNSLLEPSGKEYIRNERLANKIVVQFDLGCNRIQTIEINRKALIEELKNGHIDAPDGIIDSAYARKLVCRHFDSTITQCEGIIK